MGRYSVIHLRDESTGAELSFVPERSGYVHQIVLGGHELLWNYPDADALTGNSGHRNLALLPFPNRLLEGEYAWGGRQLKFPVNKPDTRSALHGFGPHAPFELVRVDLHRHRGEAHLRYLHAPAEHPGAYPFLVRFDLTLGLDAAAGMASWRLAATNLGDAPAPVGLGWHPYFLVPGGADAWTLTMPPNERVELERAIPTGQRLAGLPPKQATPLDTDWDDCFALSERTDRTVELRGPDYGLRLTQGGDTRYTQLYMPPDAGSVAVEPMSCGVNAFQRSQDEVSVAPGEQVSTSMSVVLAEAA